MNKLLAVIVCCAVMAVSVIGNDEKFTTKYDNMNLDEVLKNDRLINKYVQCVMETVSCTPDGELLKELIPDAFKNDCGRCSEKQKVRVEKVVRFLSEKKPDLWKQLVEKLDPERKYSEPYLEKLKKLNA